MTDLFATIGVWAVVIAFFYIACEVIWQGSKFIYKRLRDKHG